MQLGDIGVLMDCHVGVCDNMGSYALEPGDSGLVVDIIQDQEYQVHQVGLLMLGNIIYVQQASLKVLG